MVTRVKAVKSLKRWQMVALIVVLIGAGGSAYTVYDQTNGSRAEVLAENQEIITVQYGDLVHQVSTNGSLVFPEKETLAFGTEGEVEELLVQEGQRVSKGDLLAKLDQVTVASLEKAVAQARLDLQSTEVDLAEVRPDLHTNWPAGTHRGCRIRYSGRCRPGQAGGPQLCKPTLSHSCLHRGGDIVVRSRVGA